MFESNQIRKWNSLPDSTQSIGNRKKLEFSSISGPVALLLHQTAPFKDEMTYESLQERERNILAILLQMLCQSSLPKSLTQGFSLLASGYLLITQRQLETKGIQCYFQNSHGSIFEFIIKKTPSIGQAIHTTPACPLEGTGTPVRLPPTSLSFVLHVLDSLSFGLDGKPGVTVCFLSFSFLLKYH